MIDRGQTKAKGERGRDPNLKTQTAEKELLPAQMVLKRHLTHSRMRNLPIQDVLAIFIYSFICFNFYIDHNSNTDKGKTSPSDYVKCNIKVQEIQTVKYTIKL